MDKTKNLHEVNKIVKLKSINQSIADVKTGYENKMIF